MVNTRRNVNDNTNNTEAQGSQSVPTPPPPPAAGPDWAQMMANQNQLIQLLAQAINNPAQHAPQPPAQAPQNRMSEFLRIRPPTFSSSVEPMDADDWLRAIGKKLDILQCTDRERVLFASHQLNGPASEWWDTLIASHANPQAISWNEFVQSFRKAHIPSGTITLKKEFKLKLCVKEAAR